MLKECRLNHEHCLLAHCLLIELESNPRIIWGHSVPSHVLELMATKEYITQLVNRIFVSDRMVAHLEVREREVNQHINRMHTLQQNRDIKMSV